MSDTCRNCGHGEGLHHYKTMQCPRGGEAAPGRRQEWLETVFTPDADDYISELIERVSRLEKRVADLEYKRGKG